MNKELLENSSVNLLTMPLARLINRPAVTLTPDTSIREAAQVMTNQRISSVLIVNNEQLQGIVTDRDLRGRAIAAGIPTDQPISHIMTTAPLTVDAQMFGFDALLMMVRQRIHHLPVMDGSRLIGMISSSDLLERHSNSAIALLGDIYKSDSPEALAKLSAQLPRVLLNLNAANASAQHIGYVISAIGEAITRRLLQLVEAKLGPPPIPYTWLTAGSLARLEQTALSDQDNGLLLDDQYDEQRHGDYFKQLSTLVCDGLDRCGYIYCPGDVMAMNPQWRQPLAQWRRYFSGWIDQPEPKALMLSSIFFDLRPLHGDLELFQQLQKYILTKSQNNRIFLAMLTGNALKHQPPLGFFRNFVLIRDGEHDKTLDLKHNGVVPIIDLARIYALARGVAEVNTQERLAAAGEQGEISVEGAADLRDALEFINQVRLQHQARRLHEGQRADNFVSPTVLSHLERNHLKDAFSVVRTMQSALAQRFQASRFS